MRLSTLTDRWTDRSEHAHVQELPEAHRGDAVSSMVYEAAARVRDPVYGCAGAIWQLQRQVNDLKAQLARAHAELAGARAQHAHLLALLCVEVAASSPPSYDCAAGYSASPSRHQLAAVVAANPVMADAVDGALHQTQAGPVGWAEEALWT
jgi:hypothetical protein